MIYFSANSRGHLVSPLVLSAMLLVAFITSACTAPAKRGVTPAPIEAAQPSAMDRTGDRTEDTPDTWSGYRLYIEAMLARNADELSMAATYLEEASRKDPSALIIKRELAVVYLITKEKTKALEVIQGILETNPEDADSLLLLVRIKLTEHKIGAAEALLEKVIKADPTREEAYYRLGLLQASIGKKEKALATYLKLLEAYPYAYAGHYYAALLYREKGNFKQAIFHLDEGITIAPEFTEARLELASIHLVQKQPDSAEKQYLRVLANAPDNLQANFAMALIYQDTDQEKRAREIFEKIATSQTRWTEIYSVINRFYVEKKDYREAHRLLTGIIERHRENPEFNYMLGFVCEKLGNSTEAIQCFKKITPNSDYYERATLFVGVQLWEQGDRDEAILTLETARSQLPESIEILSYLASFYEDIGRFTQAEESLLRSIEINPEDPSLHFRIGVLYDKWGKTDASTTALKKALDIDPEDPNALNYLGYSYARQGIHLEDAERLIKKAMEKRPGDGYITDSLGWVYYQKGMFPKALETLQRAADLLPSDPVVLEHLGDALVKNNRQGEAIDYYKKSLDFGHEDAPSLQKKIRDLGGQE